jgi:hypothetical protein
MYNGTKPAPVAWTVETGAQLLTALNQASGGQTIVLRGKSAGGNYASGTGRKAQFPSKTFSSPVTIRAADHDDMPLFQGGESANWMRMALSNVVFDGIEFYDDETYASPIDTRAIFYNAPTDSDNVTFRRCYLHGKAGTVYRDVGLRALDWRGSTGLRIEDCIFSDLKSALNVQDDSTNTVVTGNSFLRIREHVMKASGSFTNWEVSNNVFDGALPGWDGVTNDPYIEHADAAYIGYGTQSGFNLSDNLMISDVDHSHSQFLRYQNHALNNENLPGISNNVTVANNRLFGKTVIALAGVRGTGNMVSGNVVRGQTDGVYGEMTFMGIRAVQADFTYTGNDAEYLDEGQNNMVNGGGNIFTPTNRLAAVNRAEFEALALARGLKTTLTVNI